MPVLQRLTVIGIYNVGYKLSYNREILEIWFGFLKAENPFYQLKYLIAREKRT